MNRKSIFISMICSLLCSTIQGMLIQRGDNIPREKLWKLGKFLMFKKQLDLPHLSTDSSGNCWERLAFDIENKYVRIVPIIQYPEKQTTKIITTQIVSTKDLAAVESASKNSNHSFTLCTLSLHYYTSWLSKACQYFNFFHTQENVNSYIPLTKDAFELKHEGTVATTLSGVPICDATDDNNIVFLMDLNSDKKRHALLFNVKPGTSCKFITDLGVFKGATRCIINKDGNLILIGRKKGKIALLRIDVSQDAYIKLDSDDNEMFVEDSNGIEMKTVIESDDVMNTDSNDVKPNKFEFGQGFKPNTGSYGNKTESKKRKVILENANVLNLEDLASVLKNAKEIDPNKPPKNLHQIRNPQTRVLPNGDVVDLE